MIWEAVDVVSFNYDSLPQSIQTKVDTLNGQQLSFPIGISTLVKNIAKALVMLAVAKLNISREMTFS
jgi:hypothetical protein